MLTHQFYAHLAALVKGESVTGSLYIAIGSGEAEWDTTPPLYRRNTEQLSHEIIRKVVVADDVQFLDTEENISETATSRLRIRAHFLEDEGIGTIRECGLFGSNATAAANSGVLLSYFSHPRIEKSSEMQLSRSLYLNLTPGIITPGQVDSRYLGNSSSEELHDLQNENVSCQINEIRYDRRVHFSSIEQALELGYDYCAYCFSRELSQR